MLVNVAAESEKSLTELDQVSNCAHDEEANTNCLRDLEEFTSVG